MRSLKVVLLNPSKYDSDGYVRRFWRGFLPSATGSYIKSMTPRVLNGRVVETHCIDESVYRPAEYMHLLESQAGCKTLVALVGVQSHQFQRASDLAAYAVDHGCMAVI